MGSTERGRTQIEVRQPALVYATRRCEDRDDADVITGTFFIYSVPYFSMVDIGLNNLYISSVVFVKLNVSIECIAKEYFVISPLG